MHALQAFNDMQARGITADVVVCGTCLTALEKGRQWQLAEQMLMQMANGRQLLQNPSLTLASTVPGPHLPLNMKQHGEHGSEVSTATLLPSPSIRLSGQCSDTVPLVDDEAVSALVKAASGDFSAAGMHSLRAAGLHAPGAASTATPTATKMDRSSRQDTASCPISMHLDSLAVAGPLSAFTKHMTCNNLASSESQTQMPGSQQSHGLMQSIDTATVNYGKLTNDLPYSMDTAAAPHGLQGNGMQGVLIRAKELHSHHQADCMTCTIPAASDGPVSWHTWDHAASMPQSAFAQAADYSTSCPPKTWSPYSLGSLQRSSSAKSSMSLAYSTTSVSTTAGCVLTGQQLVLRSLSNSSCGSSDSNYHTPVSTPRRSCEVSPDRDRQLPHEDGYMVNVQQDALRCLQALALQNLAAALPQQSMHKQSSSMQPTGTLSPSRADSQGMQHAKLHSSQFTQFTNLLETEMAVGRDECCIRRVQGPQVDVASDMTSKLN